MTHHHEIPVDPLNPGQVLACLGFVEASLALGLPVLAHFEGEGQHLKFVLSGPEKDPFLMVLQFLEGCEVQAANPGLQPSLDKWSVPPDAAPPKVIGRSRLPILAAPAAVEAILVNASSPGVRLCVSHWGDGSARDKFKFWAGMGGYPGAALVRDALAELIGPASDWRADPFKVQRPLSSSLRLDPRGSYIPMDAGFSLNSHSHITTEGYPLVETLAAVGLSHARPARPDRRDKLRYHYAIPQVGAPLPPALLRAAIGDCGGLPFATRRFHIALDWPGQEGQARAITTVTEETQA